MPGTGVAASPARKQTGIATTATTRNFSSGASASDANSTMIAVSTSGCRTYVA